MTFKAMLGTKTGWAGLAMVGYGAYKLLAEKDSTGMQEIMQGFGFIFAREAIMKNGYKEV